MSVVQLADKRKERDVLAEAMANAVKTLRQLHASGIDGYFPLLDLIKRCRNSAHFIDDHEAATLKRMNLLQDDGSVSDVVRRAVLDGTSAGQFFGF